MRITPDIEKRKFFERKVARLTKRVLVRCRQSVIDLSQHTDPDRLKQHIAFLLNPEPMQKHLDEVWGMVGGRFGYDTEKLLRKRKSVIPDMETKAADDLKKWENKMRAYSAERSLAKAKREMTTVQKSINKVIDLVIQKSLDDGLGILDTRKLLTNDLVGDVMLEMEKWQADRIAMTEVGSAQNTGSFMAVSEDPEGVKKVWMFIPGRKTFRENHQQFEADGPQAMDHEYFPGLKYPGDPECEDGSETINCFCSITYSTED